MGVGVDLTVSLLLCRVLSSLSVVCTLQRTEKNSYLSTLGHSSSFFDQACRQC